jgi:serine/threonine-protein kinase
MALREKFGRLVLLEETEAGALGREYRAARLGPAGLDRLVAVLRFGPEVSSSAEASRRLMEEARHAARLQSPGLVRVLGIGRVEQSFYISTELAEGRSVATILERCRAEAFPFAAEHALMIASRVAAALESLHVRKDEAGDPLAHGLVTPARLVVAFDGEVKIKGVGLWPALRHTGLLPPAERRYLAPEQAAGAAADARSDVYALGLVLLESLTGQGPDASPLEGLADARITGRVGEALPLPKPLEALLRRALDREPGVRFAGMADLRKAIDALLFSGDFTPTTFDLAFFMHTLFREDMEREARALEEARRGDYREFLADEKGAAPPAPPEPAAGPATEPVHDEPAPPRSRAPEAAEGSRPGDRPPSSPASGVDPQDVRAAAARARDAASRMTLGGATAPPAGTRRGLWLMLGVLAALVLGGGGGWLYFVRLRGPAAPRSTDETAAAQARVQELEARIAQLEREKAAAETKAAEDARKALESQAAARGRTVDPAAVARAQQEARERARREQEDKQQEEMARLATARSLEVQRIAEATPAATPTPTPTPEATPEATPTPTPLPVTAATLAPAPAPQAAGAGAISTALEPAGERGAPVSVPPAATTPTPGPVVADPRDPGVKPPVVQSEQDVPYPSQAISRRISTTVVVRALVDAQGRVAEASIVQPSGQPAQLGFDEAALKRVRSRRYRPARRHDVPVAMWVLVRIDFKPPPVRF